MRFLNQLYLRFSFRFRYVLLFIITIVVVLVNVTITGSNAEFINSPAIFQTQKVATQPLTVLIDGFQFKPDNLTVKLGTMVTFTNKDGVPHTVTPEKGGTFTDTGRLQKNDSKQVKFNQIGEQNYFCQIHPSMKGKVKVIN